MKRYPRQQSDSKWDIYLFSTSRKNLRFVYLLHVNQTLEFYCNMNVTESILEKNTYIYISLSSAHTAIDIHTYIHTYVRTHVHMLRIIYDHDMQTNSKIFLFQICKLGNTELWLNVHTMCLQTAEIRFRLEEKYIRIFSVI